MRSFFFIICLSVLLLSGNSYGVAGEERSNGSNAVRDCVIVFGGDPDYPPYEFINEKGEASGFNIDLIRAISEALGCTSDIRLGNWPNLRRNLAAGKEVDVLAMYFLPQREEAFDFSEPNTIEYTEIFVRKKDASISSLEDLAGKRVLIARGSFVEDYFKAHPLKADFTQVDSEPEALRLLAASDHDAAIVGQYVGRRTLQRFKLDGIRTAGKPILPREYCLAVTKGRKDLLKDLNMGLRLIKADGRFEEIHRKWFGDLSDTGWPLEKIARYAAFVLSPLVLLILLSLTWTWSLKKQVGQRTRELRKELAERKAAEQGLRESAAILNELKIQFETILKGISTGITLLDRDLEIVWTNSGLSEGPPDETQAARSYCRALCRKNRAECCNCPVLRCFETGEYSESVLTATDDRKWEVRAFPLRTPEEQTRRVIAMATDITEKSRLEAEASAANRLASLGVLAAGVAHEINNPNGLILLHVPMLQKSFEDLLPYLDPHMETADEARIAGLPYPRLKAEVPRIFQVLLDSARRIRQIVEDMKNFSFEKPMGLMESVDVNRVVEVAVRLTRHAVNKATDNFHVTLEDGLPPVRGNSQRLEQLMVNLIMNACEALPDRKHSISLTTAKNAETGGIMIRIDDEGVGMSPEIMTHALDPFYTTRRDRGGTGLGLSISSKIVKEHGGKISFYSMPNAGTSVVVSLPFSSEDASMSGDAPDREHRERGILKH